MPTRDEFLVAELQSTSENDWSVSQNKRFRASIIVWGMSKSLSTLEIRAKLADIGLASQSNRTYGFWPNFILSGSRRVHVMAALNRSVTVKDSGSCCTQRTTFNFALWIEKCSFIVWVAAA